jgi:hypothetical protein
VTAVLQKSIVAGSWIGVVACVRAMTSRARPAARVTALIVAGWTPLALLHAAADGHNDSVMVFLLMLGLLWLEQARSRVTALAFGASIAVKYVAAPLLVLVAVRGAGEDWPGRRRWFRASLFAAAVSVVFVAMFYRSPEFFAPLGAMRGWHFFTPSAVFLDFLEAKGIARGFSVVIDAMVVLGSGAAAFLTLRRQSTTRLRLAALWIMFGLLTGAVGHVWPWFVLWLLGLAAIQLSAGLGLFSVGMAAAAPLIMIPWRIFPELSSFTRVTIPGLLLYAAGFAALLVGRGFYLRKTVRTPSPGA